MGQDGGPDGREGDSRHSAKIALDKAMAWVYTLCMSKPKPLEPLVQVHILLPPELVKMMDRMVASGVASNRTEIIRRAVRQYIEAELKREPK